MKAVKEVVKPAAKKEESSDSDSSSEDEKPVSRCSFFPLRPFSVRRTRLASRAGGGETQSLGMDGAFREHALILRRFSSVLVLSRRLPRS